MGVFNHADPAPPDLGFPCYWLYEDPADSPYVGIFAEAAFFNDLDYAAIDVTNKVGATSCWLDPFRSLSMSYLGDRPKGFPQIEPPIMRMLNIGKDFSAERAPTPYLENLTNGSC